MKHILVCASFVVLVVAGVTAVAPQTPNRPGGVVIMKSADVPWTDYPGRPGVKLAVIEGDMAKAGPFMIRVKFPKGYALGPHTHPAVEHTTVLSGVLQIGYGTKDTGPTEKLPAGTVIVTPPNTPHFLKVEEETIVQTHGIGPWGSTAIK